jgi:CBS domain containing-hemolysin-like protein
MLLLVIYVLVALGFSFLCSVAEAVMLSVTTAHITLLEQQGRKAGSTLRALKNDVNKPLAAILTLNTIAHTVGAAGAGAQAAAVFGNAYVGVASAILTLLILVFSEIIPKTLGAHYWRQLAPVTAKFLDMLIWVLYPFVVLSEKITRGMAHGPTLKGFSRKEFAAMAELGSQEGQLAASESAILRNLFVLRDTPVRAVMTPRTVLFALPETTTVEAFFQEHGERRFSRIPVYAQDRDHITGFVLRNDLLLAQARGNSSNALTTYRRDLPALHSSTGVDKAFNQCIEARAHIMLVVDEYGGTEGVVTLEDIFETLIGLDIVDEGDRTTNMQQLARKLWRKRAEGMGLDLRQLEAHDNE